MSELQGQIEKWLTNQGYPLEMETASMFASHSFAVQQSFYYRDFESAESRETDVVAFRDMTVEALRLRLSIVAECKASEDKPWVLLSTGNDRVAATSCIQQRPASSAGQRALKVLAKHSEVLSLPLFAVSDNCGYGLVQALGKDNRDDAYKALISVSHAACSIALCSDHVDLETKTLRAAAKNYAHILFPTLVVGGTLWLCSRKEETGVNASTRFDLTQINSGVLVWKNQVLGLPHTLIHVVTRVHLAAFAAGAAETFRCVESLCNGVAKSSVAGVPASYAERRSPRVSIVEV